MSPLTAEDFGTVFSARDPGDPAQGVDWKVFRRATLVMAAKGHAPTNAEARMAASEAIRQLIESSHN